MLGHHDHDEQVVDLREGKKRRVEKRHREEPRTAESERQGMKPTDERPHGQTEYAERRSVITLRLPRLLAAAACVCGVAAWIRFLDSGLVLSHYDAKAHLVVARRVIDSITPGWQQIGAVWLPLPHLIQIAADAESICSIAPARSRRCCRLRRFAVMVWAAARLVLPHDRTRRWRPSRRGRC